MMKENTCFTLLCRLGEAAVNADRQAAEAAQTALEQELWSAFITPLDRAALFYAGEALTALCTAGEPLRRGGRAYSPDNRRLAEAILTLARDLPALRTPGHCPDSAAFRQLLAAPGRTGDAAFREAAARAWQALICAALTGI